MKARDIGFGFEMPFLDLTPTTYAKLRGIDPASGFDGCRGNLCAFDTEGEAKFPHDLYYGDSYKDTYKSVILNAPSIKNLPILAHSLYINSKQAENAPTQFSFKEPDVGIGPHVKHLWVNKHTDLKQFEDLHGGSVERLHLFDPHREPSIEEVIACEGNIADCPAGVDTYDFSNTGYGCSYGIYNACAPYKLSDKVTELNAIATQQADTQADMDLLMLSTF